MRLAFFVIIFGGAFVSPCFSNNHYILSDLHEEVRNHDFELEEIRQQIAHLEDLLEGIRESLKEQKGSRPKSDGPLAKDLTAVKKDLKAFQKFADELSKSLADDKKELKQQGKEIALFRKELKQLLSAFDIAVESEESVYQVKNGDSLGKIAIDHKTSIKKIKELNNLKNDRIFVGQKLKIPGS